MLILTILFVRITPKPGISLLIPAANSVYHKWGRVLVSGPRSLWYGISPSAPHRQLGSFFHGLHKRLELWPADAGQIWYHGHRFIRVNAIVLLHHLPILFLL